MPSAGPLIPRRRLGVELRRLREAAGLHLEDAAAQLECSISKISRLETGQGIPKSRDIRDLLALYNVEDRKAQERLLRWASDGRRQGWWQDVSDTVNTSLESYISLESEASKLRSYVGPLVHALLQTKEYATEVLRASFPKYRTERIDEMVELRMRRQTHLAERAEPLQLHVILDEATLHRVVGSPQIMRAQLGHLLDQFDQPNLTLRVYPFAAGPDLGIQCTFGVFTFDSDFDRNAVHIEMSAGDRWLEQEAEVTRYTRIFDELVAKSLSAAQCRDYLHHLQSQY